MLRKQILVHKRCKITLYLNKKDICEQIHKDAFNDSRLRLVKTKEKVM
jgi:hypothetical protein